MAAPSLALEVFLYFGKLWDVVFWLISFMVFCYKGYNLPYPSNAYEMEFTYLFMYLLIEPPRLFLGSQGNKSVRAGPLWASMTLAGFILFMHVYYIVAQTFVLRVDYWMNIISLVFLSAQFLLSGTQALDFMRGA